MADEEEDDLLSICCDEPSWSRQTTEDLDLDIGELSCQVSTDSESEAWPTIEEVEANAKLVAAIEEPAPVSEKAEKHWEHHVLLPEVEYHDMSMVGAGVVEIEQDLSWVHNKGVMQEHFS